jgi:hypothetical protein
MAGLMLSLKVECLFILLKIDAYLAKLKCVCAKLIKRSLQMQKNTCALTIILSLVFISGCSTSGVKLEKREPASSDIKAPIVKQLKLEKSVFSPGESLTLLMKAEDDISGVSEDCCSAVWVNPSGNVFRHSDGVNGQISSLGNGTYRVSNLPINPYVNANSGLYKLERFSFYDKAGNRAELSLSTQDADFYSDQNGNLTNIKTLSFSIKQNQQADNQAPKILSLKTEKDVFSPGESLAFKMNATDNISGVANGCCVAVWISPSGNIFKHSDGVNGQIKALGGNEFAVSNFPINEYVDTGVSEYTVSGFSIYDKAGNRSELRLNKPTDSFYTDQDGKQTNVAVIKFGIK